MNTAKTNNTILRLPAVKAQTGIGRSTLYNRMAQGLWTTQVQIGPRMIGWPSREVDALNSAHIAGYSEDQIRKLVTKLMAARKSAMRGGEE